MMIREYIDKFKNLHKYMKDIYHTEERKSEKFHDGLHVCLRGKLNLYARMTFRGWVEKAIEQKKLYKELDASTQMKPNQQAESS